MDQGTHASKIVGWMNVQASAPAAPNIGDTYFNTTLNAWFRWTGNNWIGVLASSTSTSTTTTTSTSTTTSTTTTSTSTSTTTTTSTSTTTTF